MKPFLALFALAASLFGQSVNLSLVPSQVYPGGTSTLTLTFADATPSSGLAGFEWILTLPPGVTAGAPVLGAAASAAAKVITCGPSICILIGSGAPLNDTVVNNGNLAAIPLNIASTATGPLSIALGVIGGTTAPGMALALTSAPVSLSVLSKYDLNADGVVNSLDVNIMLAESVANTCSGQSVFVGDGKCDVADVQLEIEAALGKIH